MMMAMEKKKKEKNEEEDVFSKLSDDVIIHILSFMDTPSAAKTSVLCKRFTPLWLSLPSLVLQPYNFSDRFDTVKEFLVLVSDLIGTISERHNTMHKIYLCFDRRLKSDDRSFRKLLPLVFDKCSGELLLSFRNNSPLIHHLLDPFLSSAPKSLTSLKLVNCRWKSLDDLISICPLLRNLSLVRCRVQTTAVRISGTQLRTLFLDRCDFYMERYSLVDRIHIEAKNLQLFSCTMSGSHAHEQIYDVVFTESLHSLKILTLQVHFETCWLEDTIPKLLALESLSILHYQTPTDPVQVSSPVKISSQSLKSLELISYSNVTIHSPMLTSLVLNECDPFSIRTSCSSPGFRSITSLVLLCKADLVPKWLELHLAKCELLLELKLISCALNGKINISHKKLERLDIQFCWGMEEAHIDTPCLRSFTHRGKSLALRDFNHSNSLEVV